MDVPFPPHRMVRLLDLESAGKCSWSDGLEMRNPKVTLKSQIGHLEPVLGPVEKIKEFEDLGLLAGRVQMETCPGHKVNHPRANQTSKWTNTYPTNDNQSHLGAFRHIRPTLKNQSFLLFGRTVFASIHKYISCIRICVYTYLRISLPIV